MVTTTRATIQRPTTRAAAISSTAAQGVLRKSGRLLQKHDSSQENNTTDKRVPLDQTTTSVPQLSRGDGALRKSARTRQATSAASTSRSSSRRQPTRSGIATTAPLPPPASPMKGGARRPTKRRRSVSPPAARPTSATGSATTAARRTSGRTKAANSTTSAANVASGAAASRRGVATKRATAQRGKTNAKKAALASSLRYSNGKTKLSRAEEVAFREADTKLLEKHELHYPGKVYRLDKQKLAVEHSGRDFVKEINDSTTKWNRRAIRNQNLTEDFVAGCERYVGDWNEAEQPMRVEMLVKFGDGCSAARWVVYSTEDREKGDRAIQEFRWRENKLSPVSGKTMRAECQVRGEDFDLMYPQRFIPKLPESSGTEYADDAVANRRVLLRAREATINAICRIAGLPPVVIEDWTGCDRDDDAIFNFEWTNQLHPSKKVSKALANCGHAITERCNDKCACKTSSGDSKACECQKADDVECWDGCDCDVETCASRVFQRGRQHPLLIIRHPVKGWTLRALERMEIGEFVNELAGEVLTAHENSKLSQTYSTELAYSLVDANKSYKKRARAPRKETSKSGKTSFGGKKRRAKAKEEGYEHRPFVHCSLRKGNEGRISSHHCRPNMAPQCKWIERMDDAFCHVGLVMIRRAEIGDELTWNYHGKKLEKARAKKEKFESDLLPACDCKDVDCMILPRHASDDTDDSENNDPDDYDSCSDEEKELTPEEAKLETEKGREARARKRGLIV